MQVGEAQMRLCSNYDYQTPVSRKGEVQIEEEHEEQQAGELRLEHVSSLPSLADLLDVLHLPAGDSIPGLSIRICYSLSAAAVQRQCPQLKGATALKLRACGAGEGRMEASLEALFSHMPLLADLSVSSTFDSAEIPECVVELRGLTRLRWHHNALQGLPPGPYLSSECDWMGCTCLVLVGVGVPGAEGEVCGAGGPGSMSAGNQPVCACQAVQKHE